MSPIKPERAALYPGDWKEIRARILDRAGDRCECIGECGDHHGAPCAARNGSLHHITGSTVVLTVAHLDHDPRHNDPSNLKAMCQRCHLRYDQALHQSNAALTRDAKRKQPRLFDTGIDPTRYD